MISETAGLISFKFDTQSHVTGGHVILGLMDFVLWGIDIDYFAVHVNNLLTPHMFLAS